jgi:hypothetical protein
MAEFLAYVHGLRREIADFLEATRLRVEPSRALVACGYCPQHFVPVVSLATHAVRPAPLGLSDVISTILIALCSLLHCSASATETATTTRSAIPMQYASNCLRIGDCLLVN